MLDELDGEVKAIKNHLKLMEPIVSLKEKIDSIYGHLETIEALFDEYDELPIGRLLCPACRMNNMSRGCPICHYTGYIDDPEYEE